MPRAPPVPPDDDEPEEAPAEPSPSKSRKTRPSHRSPAPKARAMRAWDDPAEPGTDAADDDEEDEDRKHERIFFRARDAWWFEPLVAAMVLIVLLSGLYAYTQNWPPVYVVESESMQHGYTDQLGLINTGDLVLAQRIDTGAIVPYVVGMETGYRTYGEYGDVVLYHPDGDTSVAPIIHRALLWVEYNANGSYSVPELAGLPCGLAANAFYAVTSTANGCGTIGIRGTLSLYGVGWQSTEVDVPMDPSILGRHSGFLTMGDNNFENSSDTSGITDQVGNLSPLVESGWIIGVARGMIPWFGAIKLALGNQAQEVPPQSWEYMGLTIVGLFLLGLCLHLFLRREGIEDDRRRLREEEEERETEARAKAREEELATQRKVGHRGLRFWATDDEEEEPEPPKPASRSGRRSTKAAKKDAEEDEDDDGEETPPSRGRPKPHIGRRSSPPSDDDDEL